MFKQYKLRIPCDTFSSRPRMLNTYIYTEATSLVFLDFELVALPKDLKEKIPYNSCQVLSTTKLYVIPFLVL